MIVVGEGMWRGDHTLSTLVLYCREEMNESGMEGSKLMAMYSTVFRTVLYISMSRGAGEE